MACKCTPLCKKLNCDAKNEPPYLATTFMLVATLEVEWVLAKLGKTSFLLMKEEHENGVMIVAMVEKQVNVFNESFIILFRKQIESWSRFSKCE